MKVLVTHYFPNYQELANITNPNKQKYCDQHGYVFMPYCGDYIALDPGFQRIKILRDLLNIQTVEYIFWQGVDTMVMNFNKKWDEFIDEEHDFFITKDNNDAQINADSFIIKNTDWSKKWLEMVLSKESEYSSDCWKEQRCMMHNQDKPEWKDKIKILPQNSINSYFYDLYKWPETSKGHFQKGDYLYHGPGLSLQERLTLFTSPRVQDNIVY